MDRKSRSWELKLFLAGTKIFFVSEDELFLQGQITDRLIYEIKISRADETILACKDAQKCRRSFS